MANNPQYGPTMDEMIKIDEPLVERTDEAPIDYGIFQINKATWDDLSYEKFKKPVEELNAEENVKMARYIYDIKKLKGQEPWSDWYGWGMKNKKGEYVLNWKYEKYLSGEWEKVIESKDSIEKGITPNLNLIKKHFGDLGDKVINEATSVVAAESG
tara:strand:+ start:594 stop:1061 length:468 start_codon:yes stop_codon:yes gene_type:complete